MSTTSPSPPITLPSTDVYPVQPQIQSTSHIRSEEEYQHLYQYSLTHNELFWTRMAQENVTWFQPFDVVVQGSFAEGNVSWFLNGKLNACYNCLDRHVKGSYPRPVVPALVWEGNRPSDHRVVSFEEALHQVCRLANAYRAHGVRKGDRVCIYMPMVPEVIYAMLACARIGAVHLTVFAGYSSLALRDRINDAQCALVVTSDVLYRGERVVDLKRIVDDAIKECPCVRKVFVLRRSSSSIPWNADRDVSLIPLMKQQRPSCPVEVMDSEDPLFLLHTSGSTGKPKGLVHTTGGYLTYAATTHKYVFDAHPGDVWGCVEDIGWITGHTYILYGPLANGITTLLFEGLPTYPTPSRYWDIITRNGLTGFYTAPNALRGLMREGNAPVVEARKRGKGWERLRVMGSVGEVIGPEAWRWYHEVVGGGRCAVVDSYWQTETGGVVVAPLPGAYRKKPGSVCLPFLGVELGLVDGEGRELTGNNVTGSLVIKRPWPGIARTIHGDHEAYVLSYMTLYPGLYHTGDRAIRDDDGFYWITGRIDDVINVSGYLVGAAEVEGALMDHPSVAEAAVVGVAHDVKGQSLFAFVTTKLGVEATDVLLDTLRASVRRAIGGLAVPDTIVITSALPKTVSGKIMRRILRKVAEGTTDIKLLGDITTLNDLTVVQTLIDNLEDIEKIRKARL